jgi:hypothetical protein
MATVTKDFRVKHGLVVEGTNATVNGSDIITEDAIVGGTQTNITVTYNPTTKVVDFVAENGVADSTTDNLAEGSTNKYFTDERAQDAIGNSVGTGISYNDTTGAISVDRTATDPWYDAAGSAATAETNAKGYTDDLIGDETVDGTSGDTITDRIATAKSGAETNAQGYVDTHSELTTGVHGVTGDVVGTTDTQDISNKRIIDTLYFTDGVTIADEGQIAVKPTTHEFEIKANYGNLDLKTVATDADVNITSQDGDIILNADGNVYKDSVSTENEIITQGRLDSYLGDNTIDGTGGNTVTDRIATAVSDLVDSAPELLDTLNELAAALGDDASFATTIGTEIGTKVSKAGDTMTGALAMGTNKITGLGTPTDDTDAATKKYVDDQTTTDVAEGTNLYFTDVRAVDALEAVVPDFTAVEINSLAKQVAATSSSLGSVVVTAFSFAKAAYRTAKFIVKIDNGTHNEVTEVLLSLDSSDNIAITEYAIVGTNGSRGTITADISGTDVRLRVNPVNDSTINVVGTLLA